MGAEDRQAFLVAGARRFGVELEPGTADRMLAYLDRMLAANETLNLTGIRDPAVALDRHLLDSLAFGLHARETGPLRTIVDLGTGGGFPGVPIALAWPATEVHLVDSTRKKIQAVQAILDELGIENVLAHWARAEELREVSGAGAVTARAVGPLAEIFGRSARLLGSRGCIVAWKSDALPAAERADAQAVAARLGMESLPDIEYELGGRRSRLVRCRRRR